MISKRNEYINSPGRMTAEFGQQFRDPLSRENSKTKGTGNSASTQIDYLVPQKTLDREVLIKKTVSVETMNPPEIMNQLQSIVEKSELETSAFRDDVSYVSNTLSAMNGQKQNLNYSQSIELDPPKETGNAIIDFVAKLCFNLGFSSEIFIGKNQEIFSDLQFLHADGYNQDVRDIRKMIKEILKASKSTAEKRSTSGRNLYSKTFSGVSKTGQLFSPKGNNNQPGDMLDDISIQIQMNKLQIAVLSYYLKNNVAKNVRKNQSVEAKRRKLERQVKHILDRFQKEDRKLHLAFLFASPLVLSSGSENQVEHRYKLMPQLNFSKEFIKIKESINSAQVQLTLTKRQCTLQSLQDVLAQRPLGIHFSGHGLLNTKEEIGVELADLYKDQGDLLLLETEEGDSQLVSRNQLSNMIQRTKCQLDFVVVATCHSEFVGRIFQQAGAKHVICIQNSEEVEDDAVITFTDQFYGMLFEQQMQICQAFEWAQNGVLLTHGQQQADIFKLLLKEDDDNNDPLLRSVTDQFSLLDASPHKNNLVHKCGIFGPFQKGKCRIDQQFDVQLKNTAPRVPALKGRQKDMFKLIQKVLNPTASRLFTLMGLPGVGKSSLIADTLGYISERSLLKGGSVFVNARGVSDCENLTRIINQQLIQENPTLFGNAKDKSQHRSQSFTVFNLILNKINIIDGNILLVIDNAEDLIAKDKNDFKILISLILQRVPQMKVLLTSRIRLTPTAEFKEEIIILNSLTNAQSAVLFRSITRDITSKEINQLMYEQPDFDKYPQEKSKWPYKKFHDHHLFTLLNGNPQSIILVAPLLADREKHLDLVRLYRKLTSDELYRLLQEEQIEDSMIASLRLSAQISIQFIKDSDPESMDLFLLLGLLPGGLTPSDLDLLWKKVTELSRINDKSIKSKQRKSHSFEGNNTDTTFVDHSTTEHSWRRAFNELQKGKLVEEIEISQGINTSQDEGTPSHIHNKSLKRTSTIEEGKAQTIIKMPIFVRNFSEGLIEDEKIGVFNYILADWFQNRLHGFFVINQNLKYMNNQATQHQNKNVVEELEYLEQNLKAFIERMVDKHGEELKVQEVGKSPDKLVPGHPQQSQKYETESDSSLSDEGVMMAELMFAGPSRVSKSTMIQKTPPSSEKLGIDERKKTQKLDPDQRKESANLPKQGSQQKKNFNRSQSKSMQRQTSYNWAELHKAYIANQELNERNEFRAVSNQLLGSKTLRWESIKKTVQDAISGMKDGQIQDPRATSDPHERAYRWWRLAMNKIKKQYRAKKSIALNGVRRIGGGDDLDEICESEEEETAASTDDNAIQQQIQKVSVNQPPQLNNLQKRFRKAIMIKYMEYFEQIWQQNNRRNTHRASRAHHAQAMPRKLSAMKYQGTITNEEGTLIYYLANLIILDQHNLALSLIEKYYLRMKKCSEVFRGNIKRFQALCTFQIVQMHCKGKKSFNQNGKMQSPAQYRDKQYYLENESKEVERQLRRAIKIFKRINCDWGLGLSYFQMATFMLQKLQIEQRLQDELKQGQVSRQNHVSMSDRRREQQKQKEISVEEVSIQSSEFLQEAEEHFRKVNHLRGLALTFKHCFETAQSGNEIKSNVLMAQEYNNKHIKYIHMFRKENDSNRDICISRSQGEDFSLLIEIVRSKKLQHPLFELVAEETTTNNALKQRIRVNVNQNEQWNPQQLAPVFERTTRAKQANVQLNSQQTEIRKETDPNSCLSDDDSDDYSSNDSQQRELNPGTIQIGNLEQDLSIPLSSVDQNDEEEQDQTYYSGSFGQAAQANRRQGFKRKGKEI